MIDDTDELTGAAPPMFNNTVDESRNSGSFGEADFSINPAVEVSPKANLLSNVSSFGIQKPY